MEALKLGGRLARSVIQQNRISIRRWHCLGRRLYSNDKSSLGDRFKEFKDEDATEILDVHEERLRVTESLLKEKYASQFEDVCEEQERVEQLNLDDLVKLIKTSKAKDLTVLQLPAELNYVDFLLIVTGRSRRHIQGLGETIRKYAKGRLNNINNVPQLEGSDSEWIALDLGNICIHIMSHPLRGAYDLESLWGVGAKYDIKLHQQDEKILTLLKKHSYSSFG
ncbi:hypothetical protein GE061_009760 [Apolygus lucorum]|uniref:Ribosomal silencing factor RsfS n=1 Tax=Apolygus lucorum TaxID=248454 RepID=A0A8S9Y155_APOLU|nr:hypothetical protein GE061_009760 [Apolygus lucorum]